MESYSVRDVERVLQLSSATIRGLIRIGFVRPARGARREFRFSFQDLIVLRTARALIQAKLSRRRIHRALRELRRHLPDSAPISGLCIRAMGDRVVVREGKSHWDAGDGQYLLGFEVERDDRGELRISATSDPGAPQLKREPDVLVPTPMAARPPQIQAHAPEDASAWFERGLELEAPNPSAALDAYQHALAREPHHAGAWVNRGRLLHALGRI